MGGGASLLRGSTDLAAGLSSFNKNQYVRVTIQDASLKMEIFNSLPPTTGGTPIQAISATDTTYPISGTWQYNNTSQSLISFISNDVTTNTVTYNANGGTGTAPPTQTGSTSYIVSANTLMRDGYTFKNWNTKSDGTGASYTPGATITSSATLYAQWTQNKIRGLKSLNADVINAQSLGVDVQRVYSFGVLKWER